MLRQNLCGEEGISNYHFTKVNGGNASLFVVVRHDGLITSHCRSAYLSIHAADDFHVLLKAAVGHKEGFLQLKKLSLILCSRILEMTVCHSITHWRIISNTPRLTGSKLILQPKKLLQCYDFEGA